MARCDAVGDNIATTPTIREYRRLYPKAEITLLTPVPEIFKYNFRIDGIIDGSKKVSEELFNSFDRVVDMFKSDTPGYLLHAAMPSVDYSAYCGLVRGLTPDKMDYEVVVGKDNAERARIAESFGDTILVNTQKTSWVTRDWGPKYGEELKDRLKIRYPKHMILDTKYLLDNKFSILDSIAFMSYDNIKLLVTPDTGILHMGACVPDLPIVGIFTNIRAHYRTPYRYGKYGHLFCGINADDDCCCSTDWKNFELGGVALTECPLKYEELVCFPGLSKVMKAVEEFL